MWFRACIPCQRTQTLHLHTKSPLVRFPVLDQRCAHIYRDIIDLLPLVRRFRYCLTIFYRFTRCTEAAPIVDAADKMVAQVFVQTCVSGFGTPQRVCDRGTQFVYIFQSLTGTFGTGLDMTASYRPQINGWWNDLIGL